MTGGWDSKIRHLFTVCCLLTLMGSAPERVEASWQIDPWKYHTSAHGQTSCQDCHGEHADKDTHPNPDNVNRKLSDFFDAEQCLSCHDNIPEDLEAGLHGAEEIKNEKSYQDCISCHSPHEEPLVEMVLQGFDGSKSMRQQCGVCHEKRPALPDPFPEDESCLECHLLPEGDDPLAVERIERLCFHCHADGGTRAQGITAAKIPLIKETEYRQTAHAANGCMVCHPLAAAFQHNKQQPGDCRQCHPPHHEKVNHDVHLGVACEACHLQGVEPVSDPSSKRILWKHDRKPGESLTIHDMVVKREDATCKRCHVEGNRVGAASIVLPPKSILCMPCHSATLSLNDTTTILSLIIFFGGLMMLSSLWFSGVFLEKTEKGPGNPVGTRADRLGMKTMSRNFLLIIRAVFLDLLLQRRLYKQSGIRWLIHSLLFIPIAFRFSWGIIALVTSLGKPEWSLPWMMLDRNHSVTAFLFDVTGIMILLGILFSLLKRVPGRSDRIHSLPRQDVLALGLIGGMVIVGFILEGMRIAMSGWPLSASYAFIGFWVSRLFAGSSDLAGAYGYVWYAHAILTGAFFAYLPFSRLSHIMIAPVVLIANEISKAHAKV